MQQFTTSLSINEIADDQNSSKRIWRLHKIQLERMNHKISYLERI